MLFYPPSEPDKPGVIRANPCHLCVKTHTMTVLPLEYKFKKGGAIFTHYALCPKKDKRYYIYFPEGRCVAHPEVDA